MKNYFIPNKDNKYNPHIFEPRKILTLFMVALIVALASALGNIALRNSGILAAIQSAFLVDLANQDRVEEKINTLLINDTLAEAAQRKANDMAQKGYFAHTSPEGLTPWFWFNDVSYDYLYAGENLAVNFTDSVDVHKAWIASPTHRKNILDSRFTEVGIATAQGFYKGRKATFVVQMFGKPRNPAVATAVLSDTGQETFPITVTGPDSSSQKESSEVQGAQDENTFVAETNVAERALVSPLTVGEILLSILAGILVITILIRLLIEFRRRHVRNSVLLLVLLLGVLVLLYTQREFLSQVVVDQAAEQTSNN